MTTTTDVIIPTIPEREQSLNRLLQSLDRTHAAPDLNVIVVEDSPTCGAGWRRGLEKAENEYVLLACDDQEFIGPAWGAVCMASAAEGDIVCPRVWLPPGDVVESQGGDMSCYQHIVGFPQRDGKEVDYTTIPFLTREAMEEIGMYDWHYSTDVWVSYRGRQLGYTTRLRHGFDVIHHHEAAGRGAGMSQMERDKKDEQAMRKELAKHEDPGDRIAGDAGQAAGSRAS